MIIPPIIGHRGASHYAPENTLASLRVAHSLGAQWVEVDAMLTRDGVLVAIHDNSLKRTTNGKGQVAQTTYSQLACLDAGSWFEPKFCHEKVPTLLDCLSLAEQLGIGVNLEIKPSSGQEISTAHAVVKLLQEHRFTRRLPLLISSFSMQSLAVARALDSTLPLGLLLHRWVPHWQEMLIQLNCVSLHANYKILIPAKIHEIKKLKRVILAYTVNDRLIAHRLYAWGVDSVFSDNLLLA